MVYNKKGFTLIEAIMVILIIAILAVGGASLMAYTVQNSIFLPNKLNMDMLAQDALDIMIEGDTQVKGLRFSRKITSAGANDMTFINQDGQTIRYRLNPSGTILRSIGGPSAAIPYYAQAGITISGRAGALFTYYDGAGLATSTAADVRRVEIGLIAATGTGSYDDWEGFSEQSSSIAVKPR